MNESTQCNLTKGRSYTAAQAVMYEFPTGRKKNPTSGKYETASAAVYDVSSLIRMASKQDKARPDKTRQD